jgi:hypothetical protein
LSIIELEGKQYFEAPPFVAHKSLYPGR